MIFYVYSIVLLMPPLLGLMIVLPGFVFPNAHEVAFLSWITGLGLTVGTWLSFVALWTIAGRDRLWRWQVINAASLVTFLLGTISPMLLFRSSYPPDPMETWSATIASILLSYIPAIAVFSIVAGLVCRLRGFQLQYRDRGTSDWTPIEPQRQLSIADLMMTTLLVAITIAMGTSSYRFLASQEDKTFGPLFGLWVLTFAGWMLGTIGLFGAMPTMFICANADLDRRGKTLRLSLHAMMIALTTFAGCSIFLRDNSEWLTVVGIGLMTLVVWEFLALVLLFDLDRPWMRLSIVRRAKADALPTSSEKIIDTVPSSSQMQGGAG